MALIDEGDKAKMENKETSFIINFSKPLFVS
jgi:hypothetical protein